MDLKSVSIQELEAAIGSSIRELLGEKYEVRVEKVDFDIGDERTASISLQIHEQKYKRSQFSN
ncbi:MAG: hypothetical protein R3335_00390 [Anaerolineales bacterium]|nr:hypothetical protein [Anaerolineales bacterium]